MTLVRVVTVLSETVLRGDNLNYQVVAKEDKAPTAKLFADICSIEESFHVLKSLPYLTSHMITTEKTLKLKHHIALDNKHQQ